MVRTIKRSLRTVGLEVAASAVNIVQLAATPRISEREARFAALQDLTEGRPALPWPWDLLRLLGETVQRGGRGLYLPASGGEWVLTTPPRPDDPRVTQSRSQLEQMDATFEKSVGKSRSPIRGWLRANGIDNRWSSIAEFLDSQWTRLEQVDTLIERIWTQLGLVGSAPSNLLQCDSWRLLIEAFGSAAFDRAIARNQGRTVQLSDYLQLTYLGGTPRAMLISEDVPFVRVGAALVNGRYPGAHVTTWADFIDKQGM